MRANKIGDAVTLELGSNFVPAHVEKINVKSVTFESGGKKYNVPGTLQTDKLKMSNYSVTVWLDPDQATAENTRRVKAQADREAEKVAAAQAARARSKATARASSAFMN